MTSAEKAKDQRLQKIYKTTLEAQNAEKASQNNSCAICERNFDHYTPFQDHLHKCCPRRLKEFCGKCNRGLLCYCCNKFVVGILEKGQPLPPLKLLAKLVAYFEKWEPILKSKGCYDEKPKAPSIRKTKTLVRQRARRLSASKRR